MLPSTRESGGGMKIKSKKLRGTSTCSPSIRVLTCSCLVSAACGLIFVGLLKLMIEKNITTASDATILSMRQDRFLHTQRVLMGLAFTNVTRNIPSDSDIKNITLANAFKTRKAEGIYVGSNYKYLKDRDRKIFSNYMAFLSAINAFSMKRDLSSNSWHFFFEDDITLHPDIDATLASAAIREGIRKAEEKKSGIIYLGICAPVCNSSYVRNGVTFGVDCYGLCAHAFGLRKSLADSLPKPLLQQHRRCCADHTTVPFDTILCRFAENVHGAIVVGMNYDSPQISGQQGILFQNRNQFVSDIGFA